MGYLFQDFTQVGSGGKFQVSKFKEKTCDGEQSNPKEEREQLNLKGDKKVVNVIVDLF